MATISIDRGSAKLAGLTADLMQKIRSGKITPQHLDWFNGLSYEEREQYRTAKRARPVPKIMLVATQIELTYGKSLYELMRLGNVRFANDEWLVLNWPVNVVDNMSSSTRLVALMDSGGKDCSTADLRSFGAMAFRNNTAFAGVRELLAWAPLHQWIPDGTMISGIRDEIRFPDRGTGYMSPFLRKVRDGFLLDCAGDGEFKNIPCFEKECLHMVVMR